MYVTRSDLSKKKVSCDFSILVPLTISAKDKNEKPFAIAFVPLMNDDGTTIEDKTHELLVYKVSMRQTVLLNICEVRMNVNQNEDLGCLCRNNKQRTKQRDWIGIACQYGVTV